MQADKGAGRLDEETVLGGSLEYFQALLYKGKLVKLEILENSQLQECVDALKSVHGIIKTMIERYPAPSQTE